MAVIFTNDPGFGGIQFAFINNVVEFYSDSALAPLTAEIGIPGLPPIVIYPTPTGRFYFNFKEYMARHINTNRFADTLTLASPTLFFDWTGKIYFDGTISFTITLSDDSLDADEKTTKWLLAVCQKQDYYTVGPANFPPNYMTVLTPMTNRSDKTAKLKMWRGYPFDYTIYNPFGNDELQSSGVNGDVLEFIDIPAAIINRLCTCHGENTDLTNLATYSRNFYVDPAIAEEYDVNEFQFRLDLDIDLTPCEGTYIKWINQQGGWNYWLFEKRNVNRNTKGLGQVDNDYLNVPDTTSPSISLGKSSDDGIKTIAQRIEGYQKLILDSLIDSPKVYLFTNTMGTGSSFNDWLEVDVKTTSFPVEQYGRKLYTYNVEIDQPTRNTMTL